MYGWRAVFYCHFGDEKESSIPMPIKFCFLVIIPIFAPDLKKERGRESPLVFSTGVGFAGKAAKKEH
jgi:hypothetical protein